MGAGFFGGEGFILETTHGPGAVFIHAGDFVEFQLAAGESLQIDTGSIVAVRQGVDYDISSWADQNRSIRGEGMFLATLNRTRPRDRPKHDLQKMRRELTPYRSGGDEHQA
jgi:uncharacterized protein (AIM24 family)